jgi:UDP-glucose 4-epimerase
MLADLPRRIAITGSAGFLGEAAVDLTTALPSTEVVAAIDLRMTQGPPGETRPFISVVRDIREPLDSLFEALEIDCVIHLAYLLRTGRNEEKARSVNVDATRSLLETCARTGVNQFVYLSSTTVYGAQEGSGYHSEEETLKAVDGFQYSAHKLEAEQLIQRYSQDHPEMAAAILRACVVMAPGADNFIAQSLGMRILPTPMGANPPMQFLHLDDFSSALEAVIAQRARGVYNIAGRGEVLWRDVARVTGAKVVPVPGPILKGLIAATWAVRLQNASPPAGLELISHPWLASIAKAEAELGWSPQKTSEAALRSWAEARAR